MRVVVAGAGIAGLTVARALIDRGHQVTVLERAGGLRTEGGGMTVWHNGATALERLGLVPKGGLELGTLVLRSRSGRAVATVDVAGNTVRAGVPATAFARGDLLGHLYDALPEGTVRFEAGCTGVTEEGPEVVVAAADGQMHRGDLLIGADGVHSAVRRILHGEAKAPTTGMASCLGVIPRPRRVKDEALFMVGPEGDVGFVPMPGERLLLWFDVPWTGAAIAKPLEVVRERYARWGSPVPELLEALDEGDLSPFPHHRHRVPHEWGRGRITLVGDAAHAMPPHLAQGMNQAFEDLAALITELERQPVEQALRSYERSRARTARRASLITTNSVVLRGPTHFTQRESVLHLLSLVPDRAYTTLHRTLVKSFSNLL